MNARYTMKVVTDFAAAHSLREYPGECSRLHGHNWKVEIQVVATALDEIGMGLDFKVIKSETKKILDELDHYNLNDIPPFDKINPTAENIAAYLYKRLGAAINTQRVRVSALTLWETERACVTYTED
ncbi:MAG: 6-carboxytetrahydropterin synthase QueD [Gammaproteobacteria bacterium]|nr:6-carboxytetrahydropterin synthase QueD [Gammaproteobacteria bacterium]MDH5694181.1 6-carboxytetrahydropterin synthase QueD [Gammaproteobacteria bacterium]